MRMRFGIWRQKLQKAFASLVVDGWILFIEGEDGGGKSFEFKPNTEEWNDRLRTNK